MSASFEELPMQSTLLPAQIPLIPSSQGTSHTIAVIYLITTSAIFVSVLSLGFQPWRIFRIAPADAEVIAGTGGEDDDRVDSRVPSVIRPYHSADQESNICRTAACESEGSALFRQIEFHQEPCDDFYAYVCKRWVMDHKLPFDAAKLSVDDTLVDDYEVLLAEAIRKGRPGYEAMRDIYLRCEYPRKGDTHLLETLSKIGLHPFPASLRELKLDEIINGMMTLGVQPYYSISLERVFDNPDQSFLLIGEPKLLMGKLRLGLDVEYSYLDDALSGFVLEIPDKKATLRSNILKIEKIMSSFMDRHTDEGLGSQDELIDVTEKFPQLASRIRAVVSQAFGTDLAKRPIKTASLKYIHAVENDIIMKEDANFLNYLTFRTFVELSADNDHDRGNVMALAYSRYAGYTSSSLITRRRLCVRMINKYEPALLMYMTMDAAANKLNGKVTFNALLDLLETVFNETISSQTGFDPDFRDSLIESVSAVNWEPIVPDAVTSHNDILRRLVSLYETAAGSKAVIESFMSLATTFRFKDFSHKTLDQWVGWRDGMLTTYARLESPFLKLEIPLPVFDYRRGADASLERFQFPRIGPRIFYAMYHAVYHLAHTYGARKKPAPFASKLRALMDCLGRQYRKLRWSESRTRIGRNSFYSNLLDFLALNPSFKAYLRYTYQVKKNERLPKLENITPRQLFFVQYARNFCEVNNATYLDRVLEEGRVSPAWYRVNGPLRNFQPFADSFLCKPNTFMNPVHRCTL